MVIISVSAYDDHAVSSLPPQKTSLLTFVRCQGYKLHFTIQVHGVPVMHNTALLLLTHLCLFLLSI